MLSSITLVGSTLNVVGTSGNETLSIDRETTGTTGVTATVDGVSQTFALAAVTAINLSGTGNDLFTVQGDFTGIASSVAITDAAGNNTLQSLSGPDTWIISSGNAGTLNGIAFSNIQNLVGSSFNDNFAFGTNGFVSGNVDGGSGIDQLDYSSRVFGVTVNIAAGTATGIGGNFSNISDFLGASTNTNMLTGPNSTNVWHITSGDTGDINQLYFFSGFQNLTGGTLSDTFALETNGFVQGTIDGGAGINSLDYSSRTTGIQVNVQTNSATGVGNSFNRIGLVVGSTAADVIIGTNDVNFWNINGPNSGTVTNSSYTIGFSGFENLVGGTSKNYYRFADGAFVGGSIFGGGGINTLDYSARTDGITLNLQTSKSTAIGAGFTHIQNFVGGSGTTPLTYNTVIGTNTTNLWNVTGPNSGTLNGTFTFSSVENLYGGTLNDTFRMTPVGYVAGVIYGGLGTNTLDYSSRTTGINVSLQTALNAGVGFNTTVAATAIGGGFAYISNLIGTSGADTLTGADIANTWNITGANSGNVNGTFTFTGIENLNGGLGVDVFHLVAGGSVSGTVRGTRPVAASLDKGGDWLDYSAITTPVSANLATGVATGFGSVNDVQNVRGGSAVNTLFGNAQGNILVGGASNDAIFGGTGRSLLIGGLGADTVKGSTADDIVIAGFTDFDSNFPALQSILAEWQSTNSFTVRVNHLRYGGGLNLGNVLVADQTVHMDGAANSISGGAGSNWFFGGPSEFQDLTALDIYNTPISTAPVLTGASTFIYTIGQAASPINSSLVLTDFATKTLSSATVKIAGNYSAGLDILGFTTSLTTGNITGTFNATTGTLTLTSSGNTATVAQFQAALQQVTFFNGSPTPSLLPRTVYFQASNGLTTSNTLTTTISINHAPTVAGTSTVSYTPGQAATVINPGITVADSDNVFLASATVKFTGNFYFPNEDFLNFAGNASTGSIVGSFNAVTGVLTLTAAGVPATVAQFQAALQLVTYQDLNSAINTTTFPRTIAFQVSDGSAVSNSVSSTINIV